MNGGLIGEVFASCWVALTRNQPWQGRARHSVRAADGPEQPRRAAECAPYLGLRFSAGTGGFRSRGGFVPLQTIQTLKPPLLYALYSI
jgi:hypothetical protein